MAKQLLDEPDVCATYLTRLAWLVTNLSATDQKHSGLTPLDWLFEGCYRFVAKTTNRQREQ